MTETNRGNSVTKTDDGGQTRNTRDGKTQSHMAAKLWLPDQPGAWAMALLPAGGGALIGGAGWRGAWIFAAWALCYCFQFTASRWLAVRSHANPRSQRYLTPALTYGCLVALVGLPLVIVTPPLLWWAPAFALLAATSFLAAWRREERTLWGNGAAVLAAGAIALVAASVGPRYYDGRRSGMAGIWPIFHVSPTDSYYLGSPLLPKAGVIAAVAFILTEYASVLFVKTMIREHGSKKYYILSVIYHVLLLGLTCVFVALETPIGSAQTDGRPTGMTYSTIHPFTAWVWCIAVCILLLRAVVLPLTRKRLKPLYTGLVEVFTSLMNFMVIIAAVA